MINSYLIKEPWTYNGEMIASSIAALAKLDSYMQENETGLLFNHITQK